MISGKNSVSHSFINRDDDDGPERREITSITLLQQLTRNSMRCCLITDWNWMRMSVETNNPSFPSLRPHVARICFIFDNLGLDTFQKTSLTTPEEKPYKLKIEVPANRYDLLCHQGLVLSLRTYIGTSPPPIYRIVNPSPENQWKAIVRKETSQIRPFFASAILRGIKFDDQRYKDFIDLQDKLHGNLCRKRTLVAIGTHDLQKMDHSKKVITYEARPPKDIKFAPLNKQTEYDASELISLYEVSPFQEICCCGFSFVSRL